MGRNGPGGSARVDTTPASPYQSAMQCFDDFATMPAPTTGSSVTIGNFDGVHRGHRALLARTRAAASAQGLAVGVLTFRPHPVQVLAPDLAPPLVCSHADKRALLASLGVDLLLEQRFDRGFAALAPEVFARRVLRDALAARHVVVGYDFTFGARRAGTTDTLITLGAELGFGVEVVTAQAVGDGLVASSTRARAFLMEGKVEGAALVLGRPHHVNGTIVRGHQRGRTLGFPTANVQHADGLLPRRGVYAGWLDWGEGARPAVANLGFNPTFGDGPGAQTVEAHVIDAPDLDLYGKPVRLFFHRRLRDERKFESVEALRARIEADRDEARRLLAAAPTPAFP
jgi:riboflavin kinase/FMN adenylyltransferase